MKLSIRYKVPLFFSATIIVTAIISIFIIAFLSDSRMSFMQRNLVRRFAYENSNEILSRNKNTLEYKMMLHGKENNHFKALFLMDNKLDLVSKYDPDKIIENGELLSLFGKGMEKEITIKKDSSLYLTAMKLEINGMLIGIIGGVFEKPSFFEIIWKIDDSIKLTVVVFLLVGLFLVVLISSLLSKQIVTPIMELARFINENNHLSPEFMKNIRLKKKKCWIYKRCNNKQCSNYNNYENNCWDSYLDNKKNNDDNPMLAPCFDCPVFISREDDEIDRLKIFLNHLISKMRYHYKQSKQYSRSLEEKVNRRTVELREMADDLIAANLKTQMIVDNVAEGIVVVDSNNLIIQFNQKAKENLFINVDIQIFGSKFEEILADKSIAEKIINVIEETKSSQKGFETELFYEVNDSKKHLWVRTTIVDNEKLEEFFVILLIRDITNEKIVDNFKNDFFHMISHDLKNPLSSVIGFLDLLLQGSAKDRIQDKQRKYLEIASKSAGDLKKMLDDLSTIIKMQSHEIKLDKNLFYLQDLFEEVKQSFYPLFIQKNVDFKYKVTPDDLKINADYHRLKQVLSNLIGNSIKSGNDIDIRLEAVKISSNIIIVVEDNGEGIPPDKIPLLFERFTQFFKYQDASQGLGLGLSIVKNIINLHNGYINVDSQVNKGTKFTITLPYNG